MACYKVNFTYFAIWMDGKNKTVKLSQESRSSGRDLNTGLSQYEAALLFLTCRYHGVENNVTAVY